MIIDRKNPTFPKIVRINTPLYRKLGEISLKGRCYRKVAKNLKFTIAENHNKCNVKGI